ncbi:hypothetical protein [Salirhabdus salicampi]|uniref:hypothetical protein n=1 Tax=Salirhabdus salicampi TaxID=476102 RepID=UPI0020C20064|nr:hypothetical protein [Salirhabdus salicampi]MCP8615462.1 hypothetical protein [Salirhabdus salicampi]
MSNKFEDKIKKSLISNTDYSTDDVDDVWNNLEQELFVPRQKKHKRNFWSNPFVYLAASTMLIAIITIPLFNNQSKYQEFAGTDFYTNKDYVFKDITIIDEPDQSKKSKPGSEKGEKNNDKLTITIDTEFTKIFNTVNSLTQESDIIIEGQVLTTNSFVVNGLLYTESKVEVSKSFIDKKLTGKVLSFIEIGGYASDEQVDKLSVPTAIKKNNASSVNEFVLKGVPTMKPKEKVLIFGIQPKKEKLISKEYYLPIGSFQGKFVFLNGQYKRTNVGLDIKGLNILGNQVKKEINQSKN